MDKMPDKHVLLKRSCKHDNKLHIETCCDFFIKYLYLKGNSKKHKANFPRTFLPRNKKISLCRFMASKIGDRLIHGID